MQSKEAPWKPEKERPEHLPLYLRLKIRLRIYHDNQFEKQMKC